MKINKLLTFSLIALVFMTPLYISAATVNDFEITVDEYEHLEFFGSVADTENLLTSQKGYTMVHQIVGHEKRTTTYDTEGKYTVDYKFEGDDFHVSLDSEEEFSVTYNGLEVRTSTSDYDSELAYKEQTLDQVDTSLNAIKEPSVTNIKKTDNVYAFTTISGDLNILGEYNIETKELSYTSTLGSNPSVNVIITPLS